MYLNGYWLHLWFIIIVIIIIIDSVSMLSINFYVYISPSLNCMNSGLSFVMRQSHFSFVGIEIPNGYCVSCTMWWLHLMRITSIWPEEYDSVEFWFDIGYCWSMLREYSGESTNFSNEKKMNHLIGARTHLRAPPLRIESQWGFK